MSVVAANLAFVAAQRALVVGDPYASLTHCIAALLAADRALHADEDLRAIFDARVRVNQFIFGPWTDAALERARRQPSQLQSELLRDIRHNFTFAAEWFLEQGALGNPIVRVETGEPIDFNDVRAEVTARLQVIDAELVSLRRGICSAN